MLARTIAFLFCICFATTTALAFDLQGHRGARGLMPENTLPAFAKALSIGVTTLEFDTGITKDGVVVISHDPALHPDIVRNEKGEWVSEEVTIRSLKFAELQKFDLGRLKPGSRTASRFTQQTPVDGTKMPSLAQVFELTQKAKNKTVRFNIETKINPFKPDLTSTPEIFAKALLEVVEKFGMESRVSIQSFDWRTLQAVQKANPSIETVYLTAQQNWLDNVASNADTASPWTAGFKLSDHEGSVPKLVKAAGGKVWSPFFRDLNAEKVKRAQDLGLKVVPWTVNDEAGMTALIKMGVDGIISDYPDVLRKVMEQQGLSLPKPTPVDP